MTDQILSINDAIGQRAYYPLAAFLITILVSLLRKLGPDLFNRIPKNFQWLPAVILNAGGAFIEAEASGEAVSSAILLALYAAVLGGSASVGAHHISKRLSPVIKEGALGIALIVSVAFSLTSCAGIKPVIKTIDDLAQDACGMFFADRMGISWEDAARAYCNTREALAPFIDPLLEAQAKAGGEAAAAQGIELEK